MESAPQERLRDLIARGESSSLEFKSSLRYDRERGVVNKELTKAVAKTIAGFLNGEGGTLLLGVSDEGGITGIEDDLATLRRPNADGFEQNLRAAPRGPSWT